ncbi:MAG: FkbM family methyltransferase [Bacteroidetes bacterium]|nr:FkbM family methyltransferase [Bacteroidota bacterium]
MNREKLIFLLSSEYVERVLLGFKRENYLYDIGWTNSIVTGKVVDASNNPVPWVTYPFIQFIGDRLNSSLDVFEFGAGNSTLYYAGKTGSVTSVDHDMVWYEKIKSTMPPNVNLFFCELTEGGDYCNYATKTGKLYDMLIVDGMDRVNCCINNVVALKPGGVMILDDSERVDYGEATAFLAQKGFKRIDFWGTAPTVYYLKCTTIFYKDNNCLGI